MLVGSVILAFLVGGFLGSIAMALAYTTRNGDEVLRRINAERRARRPLVDRRYIELERARRQPAGNLSSFPARRAARAA
jgi:hypothetical protein